jgi:hypothetical protein
MAAQFQMATSDYGGKSLSLSAESLQTVTLLSGG